MDPIATLVRRSGTVPGAAPAHIPPPAHRGREVAEVLRELTSRRLPIVGFGDEKVVYKVGGGWIAKRPRTDKEALRYVLTKRVVRWLRSLKERGIRCGRRRSSRPLASSMRDHRAPRAIHGAAIEMALQIVIACVVGILPTRVWAFTRAGRIVARNKADAQIGEAVARQRLEESGLVPRRVALPERIKGRLEGWPRTAVFEEVYEEADFILSDHFRRLISEDKSEDMRTWLRDILRYQVELWRRGAFTASVSLRNLGVTRGHIVLLDNSLLKDDLAVIEQLLVKRTFSGFADIRKSVPEELARDFLEKANRLMRFENVRRCWKRSR